jgi:hypothetical protein
MAIENELLLQSSGDLGATSCHDNTIVRRMLGPAECAIAMQEVDVVIPQFMHAPLRQLDEFAMPFYSVHFPHDPAQHSGSIARASADF